jgi:hypothetical protein
VSRGSAPLLLLLLFSVARKPFAIALERGTVKPRLHRPYRPRGVGGVVRCCFFS